MSLAVLALALLLGCGVRMWERPVQAQAAGIASTPEAQSPAKDEEEKDDNDAYRKSPSVVAIGGHLGMNADQSATAFTIFNFALMAILVDARTATEEARVRLSSVEERLVKLDGEIAAMRSHAEQDAAREEQRLRAAIEEERKKILASAEQEISAATLHARKRLQEHAAELAIEQAARKLVVTAETDRLLVQGFAQRLTGDDAKKGQN
jgi:F-type H+-transporting ATPase subunit b